MFSFQDGENWFIGIGVGLEYVLRGNGKSHVACMFCGQKIRISKTASQKHLIPIS
jgi:hypothetical protein